MLVRTKRGWEIREGEATPEPVFLDRRAFLGRLGGGVIGAAASGAAGLLGMAAAGCAAPSQAAREYVPPAVRPGFRDLYPARRSPRYTLDRPITFEGATATLNNFYEFTETKTDVHTAAQGLTTHPWAIEVAGLVEKPFTIDVDTLVRRLPLEERLYRHRCVEAWAMAVPWTGFPLRAFVDLCKPTSAATHLSMVSFHRISEAPGQLKVWYPWPYYEALTLDEARNELAFLATGIYGHELPKQNGAPLRLVLPWKYGLKSIKSIVRFEFTPGRPATFWSAMSPGVYGFFSNVMPTVPHPNWKQETETMIGTLVKRATLPFNGYGKWVAELYPEEQRRIT